MSIAEAMPACVVKGCSAVVSSHGLTVQCARPYRFTDAARVVHVHSGNRLTRLYGCNDGHQFEVSSWPPCACGWVANATETKRLADWDFESSDP